MQTTLGVALFVPEPALSAAEGVAKRHEPKGVEGSLRPTEVYADASGPGPWYLHVLVKGLPPQPLPLPCPVIEGMTCLAVSQMARGTTSFVTWRVVCEVVCRVTQYIAPVTPCRAPDRIPCETTDEGLREVTPETALQTTYDTTLPTKDQTMVQTTSQTIRWAIP